MIRINIIWLTIALMCLSCRKNEPATDPASVSEGLNRSSIVGEWRIVTDEPDVSMIYTLKDNGEFLTNGNLGLASDEEDPFGGDFEMSSHWHFARLDESRDILILRGMISERYDHLVDVTIDGDQMVWMSLRRDSQSGQLLPDADSKCFLERVKQE